MQQQVLSNMDFPFTLADLDYWLIVREDDTCVKFTHALSRMVPNSSLPVHYQKPVVSMGAYCRHDLTTLPIYETPEGDVQLFICDYQGARAGQKDVDIVIDGGNVLTIWAPKPPRAKASYFKGDAELIKAFSTFVEQEEEDAAPSGPRVLQIDWLDRKAPPLHPGFWPAMAAKLRKDAKEFGRPLRVMTCCQGGHGRSGSALVALMMAYTNYSPLDAITHLRALHCARAIESTVQHDYLNRLAAYLERDQNSHDAHDVGDFRKRFLASTCPEAEPFKARLEGK